MNRYLFLHRIKGPAMILVFGITALLDEWHVLSFGQSWPLYLIVLGALMLAERAAWSQVYEPPNGYQVGGQPGAWGGPGSGMGPGGQTGSSTALSIAPPHDLEPRDREGR